jgi:hypothetical protein
MSHTLSLAPDRAEINPDPHPVSRRDEQDRWRGVPGMETVAEFGTIAAIAWVAWGVSDDGGIDRFVKLECGRSSRC